MTDMCATLDSQNDLQPIAVLFIASPRCYSVTEQQTNYFTVWTPRLRKVKFVKTIQLETDRGRCEYGHGAGRFGGELLMPWINVVFDSFTQRYLVSGFIYIFCFVSYRFPAKWNWYPNKKWWRQQMLRKEASGRISPPLESILNPSSLHALQFRRHCPSGSLWRHQGPLSVRSE